jgi:hypothetical protein
MAPFFLATLLVKSCIVTCPLCERSVGYRLSFHALISHLSATFLSFRSGYMLTQLLGSVTIAQIVMKAGLSEVVLLGCARALLLGYAVLH